MARLKTTDVYERLQGKYDPELVKILAHLVERDDVAHMQLTTCAQTINQLIDRFADIISIVGKNQEQVAKKLGFKNVKSMIESFEEKDDSTDATG